jgi:hypothetical protein
MEMSPASNNSFLSAIHQRERTIWSVIGRSSSDASEVNSQNSQDVQDPAPYGVLSMSQTSSPAGSPKSGSFNSLSSLPVDGSTLPSLPATPLAVPASPIPASPTPMQFITVPSLAESSISASSHPVEWYQAHQATIQLRIRPKREFVNGLMDCIPRHVFNDLTRQSVVLEPSRRMIYRILTDYVETVGSITHRLAPPELATRRFHLYRVNSAAGPFSLAYLTQVPTTEYINASASSLYMLMESGLSHIHVCECAHVIETVKDVTTRRIWYPFTVYQPIDNNETAINMIQDFLKTVVAANNAPQHGFIVFNRDYHILEWDCKIDDESIYYNVLTGIAFSSKQVTCAMRGTFISERLYHKSDAYSLLIYHIYQSLLGCGDPWTLVNGNPIVVPSSSSS